MTETFYRLHSNPEAPCLCADHAYSGLALEDWNEDGSAVQCPLCLGTGYADEIDETPCRHCECGWIDVDRGYSCFATAEELVRYMIDYGSVPAAGHIGDLDVAVFEGEQVGTGPDGEPLAVPTGRVEWTTWSALTTLAGQGS